MTKQTQRKSYGEETIEWDLTDLFSGLKDPKIQSGLDDIQEKTTHFVKNYKGKLENITPENLLQAYIELELLLTPLYKISQYIGLRITTETDNPEIKALESRVDEIGAEISNQIVFFDLELAKSSDAKIKEFLNYVPLKNYHYSITRSKETAKYNLSEKEEQIITLKDLTGEDALVKLYEELTSGFEFEFEVDGEVKKMNGSQLRNLRLHPDKEVRRRAMKTFYKRYEDNKTTITAIFNNIVKSKAIEKKLRGYTSPIAVKNIGNDLTDEAVQTLHDVTNDSNYLVNRYYKIKKTLLEIDELTLADIYAPLPKSNREFTYEEAKAIVLEGFLAFDQEAHDLVKSMFDENRIDARVLPKKRGGAFCSGYTPDVKPYVMLNFMGKPRDVSTMAHELGHALHDMYCNTQTLLNFHPILPLAETASVFAEMLITDLLLKKETTTEGKIAILTDKLEDIFATSHRQNMFSTFEMKAHETIDKELQDSTDLCKLYRAQLENMFGDAVTYTDEYKWEWSTIPHIFASPFYVYAYNFGNLLVMALYQQYLEEGATFIPKYKQLLSMGSAARPTEITAIVGADINSREFWQKSIRYIESLVTELENLVKQ